MKKLFLALLAVQSIISLGAQANNDTQIPATEQAAGLSAALLSRAGFGIPTRELVSTDFTLDSLSGGKLSLGSFKGKIQAVDLTSCSFGWSGPRSPVARSI